MRIIASVRFDLQTILQYFGSEHGVASSGFVTREVRPLHARTVRSISAQASD